MDNKRIIDGIKNYYPNQEQVDIIEDMAANLKDKSEDDVFVEIIKINSEMEERMSKEEYEKIFDKLEGIRHLLSEEQNLKLDRVLEVLNKKK